MLLPALAADLVLDGCGRYWSGVCVRLLLLTFGQAVLTPAELFRRPPLLPARPSPGPG